MCGIAGILSSDPVNISRQRLKEMTDAIAHRGPDGEGFWINPSGQVGLGHRRLAIIDLSPAQFLTEVGDAADLLEAEQGAVEHMNEDHPEAMNLYATRLLGAESAEWRCTGCDPDGMDMQAGTATLRLDFPERVTSAMALRKMLVRLAGEARAKN